MSFYYVERRIRMFDWSVLQNLYGCARSTITGFISAQWLAGSYEHSILDGAPAPGVGGKGMSRAYSDLLLFRNDDPMAVVGVATEVDSYARKLDTLYSYLENGRDFEGLDTGLLFMINKRSGPLKFRHNWDGVKKRVRENRANIILVSLEKEKMRRSARESVLERLRKRNDCYPWDIVSIDYWSHFYNHRVESVNLWRR